MSDKKYGRNKASAQVYKTTNRLSINKKRRLERHLRHAAKKAGRNVSAGTPGCPPVHKTRPLERVYYQGVVRAHHWPMYLVYAAEHLVEITDSHNAADAAYAKATAQPKRLVRIDYPGAPTTLLQMQRHDAHKAGLRAA